MNNFCRTVFFSKALAKAAAPASPIGHTDRNRASVKQTRQPPRTNLHQNHTFTNNNKYKHRCFQHLKTITITTYSHISLISSRVESLSAKRRINSLVFASMFPLAFLLLAFQIWTGFATRSFCCQSYMKRWQHRLAEALHAALHPWWQQPRAPRGTAVSTTHMPQMQNWNQFIMFISLVDVTKTSPGADACLFFFVFLHHVL